jgi:hypothetical protein
LNRLKRACRLGLQATGEDCQQEPCRQESCPLPR